MKQKKRVRRRGPRKVSQIRASVDGEERPRAALPEWPRYHRPIKKAIRLRLDADVLDWFKRQGPGYQTRMNRALRRVMMEEEKGAGG